MSHSRPKPTREPSPSRGRNQYIPNFIARKPFYLDDSTISDADYLEHQRLQSLSQDTLAKSRWYDRGRKLGPAATKFRKGACENCGAMTHRTKDCLSRPRKEGAKWTGKDIQADEVVDKVNLGWDAKRDRWNGYDAREYSAVIKEYEELEALKKAATASDKSQPRIPDAENAEGDEEGDEATSDDPPGKESAKYGEESDMGRNQPTSTRNLRIREDTANYLMNLDLDSARYDPKSRSMAANVPKKNGGDGDNNPADNDFVRPAADSGDAAEFQRAQLYAWETQERISSEANRKKIHLQANPTEGEVLLRKRDEETTSKKDAGREALLAKYGGVEHLVSANGKINASSSSSFLPLTSGEKKSAFRAAENERYIEYDADGNVKEAFAAQQLHVNGQPMARSKYPEDVLSNNHTSIWGSWWHDRDHRWGYRCCHSTVKNSYCTGEEGKRAMEEAQLFRWGVHSVPEADDDVSHGGTEGMNGKDSRDPTSTSHPIPPTNNESNGNASSRDLTAPTKRTYHDRNTFSQVTEEEMEQYKRAKTAADDPMAKFIKA